MHCTHPLVDETVELHKVVVVHTAFVVVVAVEIAVEAFEHIVELEAGTDKVAVHMAFERIAAFVRIPAVLSISEQSSGAVVRTFGLERPVVEV